MSFDNINCVFIIQSVRSKSSLDPYCFFNFLHSHSRKNSNSIQAS